MEKWIQDHKRLKNEYLQKEKGKENKETEKGEKSAGNKCGLFREI
jgi:hypothetical protein